MNMDLISRSESMIEYESVSIARSVKKIPGKRTKHISRSELNR